MLSEADGSTEHAAPAVALLAPRDGLPDVVVSLSGLESAAELLDQGDGPVAIDAERASGFRYSSRAYLIQLRRAGSGTFLIDPIDLPSMAPLAAVLNKLDWILHAADQDLPCLAEVGLHPRGLFDTELGGRLAGFDRVNLAAMVERMLGLTLAKGHGAADWSRRPLPEDWLNYAALDVEVLLELAAALATELQAQGKLDWALEEFEYVRRKPGPRPNPDRWRRLSNIHKLRSPRQLEIARQLWDSRDRVARSIDVAQGRVLPDSAIIDAALLAPTNRDQLLTITLFNGPRQRRNASRWLQAIQQAFAVSEADLPEVNVTPVGPPPPNRWDRRNPEGAQRLTAARAVMAEVSEAYSIPVENLLLPDTLRRLCWEPLPDNNFDCASVDRFLITAGARTWQRNLVLRPLSEALIAAMNEPVA